jgi:glycine dehydrogenase subunit 1
MGRRGVQEVARQNVQKAHYAAAEIAKLDGFSMRFSAPFFNEFVVRTPGAASEVTARLLDQGIVGGVALECYYPELRDCLLVCVTETASKEMIDRLAASLGA